MVGEKRDSMHCSNLFPVKSSHTVGFEILQVIAFGEAKAPVKGKSRLED